MAYFPDLSPYTYFPPRWNEHVGDGPLLNIGWLDVAHPFTTFPDGVPVPVPAGFLDRLRGLPRSMATRGWHRCPFCAGGPSGSAELRVAGPDGTVYAAPTLLIHYVEVHGYAPPPEFIEAVMASR